MALYFEENLKMYVEKLYFMKKEAFLSSVSFESIIIRAEVKKKQLQIKLIWGTIVGS